MKYRDVATLNENSNISEGFKLENTETEENKLNAEHEVKTKVNTRSLEIDNFSQQDNNDNNREKHINKNLQKSQEEINIVDKLNTHKKLTKSKNTKDSDEDENLFDKVLNIVHSKSKFAYLNFN